MLLVVDTGNTETKIGIFKGEELQATWHVATAMHRRADEYGVILLNLLQHQNLSAADITEVALCSVVPPLIAVFEELSQRYFNISPLIVGAGVRTGVRIRMDNPREVGPDRIANAAAAHQLYSGPLIVADMGTATTFDAISEEGDYLGGAIAPGMITAAEALFSRTAMLRRVEFVRPKQAIGTNTVSALQSGIIFGYVGLIEGIVARMQQELGGKARVVATGGYAELLAKETGVINITNPHLTLVGLRLIYLMNRT